MKIAIVGSGISGMVTAYLLGGEHEIVFYETNDYIGGHTNTREVDLGEETFHVDTGFIVFNEVNYPNFCKLLNRLKVPSQPSCMSFSVKCEKTGLEYNPHSLRTLFAQKKNLFSLPFYRMLFDIIRFRRRFDSLLSSTGEEETIGSYLDGAGYSRRFVEKFIIPLGAAIWSADPRDFREFPLRYFVQFFKNHGFLQIRNPFSWQVIQGGSKRYVEKLIVPFQDKIRLQCPITKIYRHKEGVSVEQASGEKEQFDQVVLAVHSDQALTLLSKPTDKEREILTAFPYQENETTLHTDTTLLPKHRRVWASWNYTILKESKGRASLTYDMNLLQSLKASREFCVTLNRKEAIDPEAVLYNIVYHHPAYTAETIGAQKRHAEISGVNRIHYCGAYWGYGFHEDGVNSALAVCKHFGKSL